MSTGWKLFWGVVAALLGFLVLTSVFLAGVGFARELPSGEK